MGTVETKCRECYQEQIVLWRNIEMNEELKEYVSSYISPPALWYPSMDAAMDVWGTKIQPEDLLL